MVFFTLNYPLTLTDKWQDLGLNNRLQFNSDLNHVQLLYVKTPSVLTGNEPVLTKDHRPRCCRAGCILPLMIDAKI